MQGQRGAIGSLPDSINFEYDSLTTNLDMDQQICWNDLRNSSENTSMGNSQEGQTLTRWNTVGSSSSGSQNLVGQIGWSPPINTSSGGNIVQQPIVNLNLNPNIVDGPTFVRGSSSGSASQNFDLNEGRFHRVGNDNSPKPIGYDSKFHHMSGSSSGSGVFPVEDTDGSRPLDGRRVSCKRKTLEGNVGQSSSGNGGNFFSRAEASMWRPLPSNFDASSSINIAETPESSSNVALPEEVNPRLGLGIGGGRDYVRPLNVSGGPERSHRNYRLRMSSSVQQDSLSNNSFLPVPVSATRHSISDIPPVHQPLRFVPMNSPIDLMSPIPTETAVPQNQSVTYGVPPLRNVQAHRWHSLRSGMSSSSSVFGEADDAFPDGSSSRSLPRNIGEHPVFAPPVEARSLASLPTHWTGNGGTVISRNIGSSSRSRSHPRSLPSAGPSQDSHRPTQYSRRLTEYVRRSLLPTGLPEVTGQSSSSQQQPVPASSQDGVLPTSGGSQGQSHSHSRSALWLERQADGTGGIPYLRALAAAGEGRSRIVSEIRNALNSIRRGEGLRIEDLMLLDQSIYFGRAEIHDQHRDMRLDVDNMSYEELLALEERIGNVCTGLTEEVIVKSLKERKHVQTSSDDQTEAEPCCVCQETYKEGEYIGTLDCGHDFHKDCIKQWLSQKNLCPICKTTGLATK